MSIDTQTFPKKSKTLWLSLLSAIALLLAMLFQWNIIDIFTPFLALPLIGLLWLIMGLIALWSLGYAYRYRKEGYTALMPSAVAIGAILLAIYIPFTDIWLYANFHLKRDARSVVVERIRAGELTPNVDHNHKAIFLPGYGVSNGDRVLIEGERNNPYVFFFTFRGILDNYSGFLWVPEGGEPSKFSDAWEPGTQIMHYGDHWYFIGHR
jgi:hypothetical protein